jgi:hypothetical protein
VTQKSVKLSSILTGMKPEKFCQLPAMMKEARESFNRSKGVQKEEKNAQSAKMAHGPLFFEQVGESQWAISHRQPLVFT